MFLANAFSLDKSLYHNVFNSFSNDLDSSNLKEFVDNNFNLGENDGKFSKWEEKNVGKGEIACYEQFLLFPQCFRKTFSADTSKQEIVWDRVKSLRFTLDSFNGRLPVLESNLDWFK